MIEKVIIMGAAGRDFHNFNVYFKDNPRYHVVAFTAAQIPDIAGRLYPPELAGKSYPEGIPIYPEDELAELIQKHKVDLVAFSYSDVPHVDVMHKASLAMAEGADFILIGATYTIGVRNYQWNGEKGGRCPASHAVRGFKTADRPAVFGL
jgi:predicted GTPase